MRKIDRPPCPNPKALSRTYKYHQNKSALENASFSKCMYCEEKILSSQFGDVEHIKPKSIFPELEFDWDNLGFVCSKCNNAKSNKYDDATPFINPYNEDPEKHIFAMGSLLAHRGGSERGELTISEITLNRSDLIEKRHEKIQKIGKTIDSCFRTQNETLKKNALEELKKEANEEKEYSLCVKSLLKLHEIF